MKKTTLKHIIIMLLKTRKNLKSIKKRDWGTWERTEWQWSGSAGEAVSWGERFGGIKKVKRTFGEGLENIGIPLIHWLSAFQKAQWKGFRSWRSCRDEFRLGDIWSHICIGMTCESWISHYWCRQENRHNMIVPDGAQSSLRWQAYGFWE